MSLVETLAAYGAVFVAAATPWLEILLVIPPAVAAGLDPFAVGAVAFAGNALPVAGIVLGYERLAAWRRHRRAQREARAEPEAPDGPGARGRPDEAPAGPGARGRRGARAKRIADRYGVPGLAIAGPILTGVHLAAVIAVALGPARARVLGWMVGSLAAWTVAITVASAAGVDRLLPGR